jgi:hypothetical protein
MFLFSQTYLKHDKLAYFSYLKEAKNWLFRSIDS